MRRGAGWFVMLVWCACSADVVHDRQARAPSVSAGAAATAGVAGVPGGAGGSPAPGVNGGTNMATPVAPPIQAPPPAAPPSGEVCHEAHVDVRPQVPDMMIVLDRSGSMGEQGRWDPSLAAVQRVTQQLQEKIRFGLALFPAPSMGGAMDVDLESCLGMPDVNACVDEMLRDIDLEACAPGRIVVPTAPQNAAPIAQALAATGPLGGTPTPGTLDALLSSFATPPGGTPSATAVPAKYILLVTDGQPTCPAGNGSATTQADIDASNTAVEALARAGVKTYVIGYDTTGPGNEMLAQVLDGLATRGGTGDTKHRQVEDEASLVGELEHITGGVVDCSFVLDMPPERVDHVLVRLDGKQINLAAADGWLLEGDRTIRVTGASCTLVRDGSPHTVDVEVRCSPVVPQ